jgi:hypothetical protein
MSDVILVTIALLGPDCQGNVHDVHEHEGFPPMADLTRTLNLTDLIALICLYRQENYAFERHLALQTFGLWVIEPNDTRFVEHGRLLAAARIANSFIKAKPSTAERKFLALEFSRKAIALGLLSPPVIGPFNEEIDHRKPDLELAASIVETFLRAPLSGRREKRPSLNKGIHFIRHGGFGSEYKFAPATIKRQWISRATTAPFFLADRELNLGLFDLAPDASQWLKLAGKILKNVDKLQEFIGLASSVQGQFVSKLDPVSRRRLRFVAFPPQTDSISYEFEPFSGDELIVYQSYKAPKY